MKASKCSFSCCYFEECCFPSILNCSSLKYQAEDTEIGGDGVGMRTRTVADRVPEVTFPKREETRRVSMVHLYK